MLRLGVADVKILAGRDFKRGTHYPTCCTAVGRRSSLVNLKHLGSPLLLGTIYVTEVTCVYALIRIAEFLSYFTRLVSVEV